MATLILALSIFLVFWSSPVFSGVYWVHPTGTASWTNCRSEVDPGLSKYCSLNTANASLVAGDTVYLKGGTYNTHILPANSGTSISARITYSAVPSESPIIKNTATQYSTYYHGILLRGHKYIKIHGITVGPHSTMNRVLMITHGASYNEISNCIFDGAGNSTIQIWDGDPNPGAGIPCVHNWIHHTTIANTGYVNSACDDIGGVQLGVPAYDKDSNYNTFESNVFYGGGHHNLETFTKFNVIRNNYFHHEGSMANPGGCPYGPDTNGKYGNRNIQIYDGYGEEGKYNLIEGNRFGHAGPPPDDDGGDGMTLTASKNIVRYNAIFNSLNNGLLLKTGAGSLADNNRIYNNTIYKSGRYRNTGSLWQGCNFRWYGSYARVGNVVKNNLMYLYGTGSNDFCGGSTSIYSDNTVTNNWLTSNGSPGFVDTTVTMPSNRSLPNLNLQSSSGAIDGGTYLTRAAGAGTNSTTLVVGDALYFQDGTWGSSLAGHQADWIAIGSINNVVQIYSVNYAANTITLSAPKTWAANANIWLYKKSDGVQVLHGPAPDFGAYEFGSGDTTSLNPPSNFRLLQ